MPIPTITIPLSYYLEIQWRIREYAFISRDDVVKIEASMSESGEENTLYHIEDYGEKNTVKVWRYKDWIESEERRKVVVAKSSRRMEVIDVIKDKLRVILGKAFDEAGISGLACKLYNDRNSEGLRTFGIELNPEDFED